LISRGEEIEDSNLLDLIHHAVRKQRKGFNAPKGWSDFVDILRRNNVPRELLSLEHGTKRSILQPHRRHSTTDEEEEEFEDAISSPQPSAVKITKRIASAAAAAAPRRTTRYQTEKGPTKWSATDLWWLVDS
jgi:hypothetical protein